jgi:TolB-like protein/predicted Zn-dependent protease
MNEKAAALVTAVVADKAMRKRRWWPVAAAAVAVLLLAVGGVLWWQPWKPDVEPASVERMAFPLPDKPSIAVLPFNNLSGDTKQDYLVDGITETIITELSRFRGLFVIARNSVFAYQGKPVKVQQVAEDLGVQYVLEGSMQRSADRVRITAQLIDATTGNHVWAESYDRELADIFAVQDEVTERIVASLGAYQGELAEAARERAKRKKPASLSAYEAFQLGIEHKHRFTKEDNAAAQALFNKAIELDPQFAQAYVGLAWVHIQRFWFGWTDEPGQAVAQTREAAQKAIALDPSEAEAHWLLAEAYLADSQFEQGEAEYERALALNPNNADLLAGWGYASVLLGEPEKATKFIEKAMRLNPHYPDWYDRGLGTALFMARRYEESIAAFRKVTQHVIQSRLYLASSYAQLDRLAEARAEVAAAMELDADISVEKFSSIELYKNPGDLEHLRGGLRKAGLPEKPPRKLPDKPSIAVLPFDNMSGDPDLDYFSDGMTEDIIMELSKNPDLKVVSRNSSFTYRDKAVKARQVSEELGVRYVLEGSVRKQGDRVRITAQLIDATTDAHVWADRFDEEGTDIFALQDRITTKIGATLSGGEGRIRKAEYKRVWEMDAAKLEEYDYYLRGHSIFFDYSPEAMLKARAIWQEGLEKFPESGLLRVKIGWTYFQFFMFGWTAEPEKELELASQWVQEGLSDSNLPAVGQWNGHWLNALVHLYYKNDYDFALAEAIKTLEIIPNDPTTLVSVSAIPVFAGEPDLAIEWINRAMSREAQVPDWHHMQLGLAYHSKGDCNRAVEEHEKVAWVGLDKSASLVACYVELGRMDDAKAELAKLLEAWPEVTIAGLDRYLPHKDQAFLDRLHTALGQAGLPE